MKPIQILNDMANKELRRRYPEIPDGWLVKAKYKQSTANEITKSVIRFLQLSGWQAERISVTGRRVDDRKVVTDVLGQKRQIGSVKWIPSSMTKGSADISATVAGRSIKIEVKAGRDRQREDQKKYQADIERAGGIYIIVHSFDEFYQWYAEQSWISA